MSLLPPRIWSLSPMSNWDYTSSQVPGLPITSTWLNSVHSHAEDYTKLNFVFGTRNRLQRHSSINPRVQNKNLRCTLDQFMYSEMEMIRSSYAHMGWENSLSPCRTPSLDERLMAESYDYWKLFNRWVGLSHKRVQDGCKGTCVKSGCENPTEVGISLYA